MRRLFCSDLALLNGLFERYEFQKSEPIVNFGLNLRFITIDSINYWSETH